MTLRVGLIIVGATLALGAQPAAAHDVLGVYKSWAAFHDENPRRCYAIGEPVPELVRPGASRAWLVIGSWPDRRILRQLDIRLSRTARAGARVTLSIGDSRFLLAAQGSEARAGSRRRDAEIIAAMRSGRSMSIESVSDRGLPFADSYALAGAASAIDAATVGCLER